MKPTKEYYNNQNIKYHDPEEVRKKWIKIFRKINPYNDPATMMQSVKEAFVLVECVMKNKLADYRNAYESYGEPVPDTRASYVFHYPQGDIVIDFADYTVFGMTKYLRAIGYNLQGEIDETRKLRNFFIHNLETTTVEYFKDNMNFGTVMQALYNLGETLVALGMLQPQDVQPSFEDMRVQEGETLGLSDEFVVDRFIAKSGTSRLYEGRHIRLNRKVAIKELLPNTFSEQLLINERDLLVSLSHPRIPHIYDVFNQNGTFYIVMDYIDGEGLDAYVQHNRCSVAEKLRLVYDICDVVNYLHASKGMIHADLKPKNVMVDVNGDVYIIDFGTAVNKKVGEQIRGVSMGYTAPEVAAGKPIDYRIDIYSIGAIMKFLFAEELRALETKRSENAEAVRKIVTRCMEYEPYKRYNNVVEIQWEINGILNNGTVSLGKVSKPKKNRNILSIVLYVVCILAIAVPAGLKVKTYIDNKAANEKTQLAEDSNDTDTGTKIGNDGITKDSAGNDSAGNDSAGKASAAKDSAENDLSGKDSADGNSDGLNTESGKTISDEEALDAFKELEQKAWKYLVDGDEDSYIALFRCNESGEKQQRAQFEQYHEDMKDIYDDFDYILLCNEDGLCYGCATRTLVSGEGAGATYVRKEFVYPFSYRDGEWKFDITPETAAVTESKVNERVYGALTENFNNARESGRNWSVLDKMNYLWLDGSLVYEDMVDVSVVAVSQMADGSIEFNVSIKNGTAKEVTVADCVVDLNNGDGAVLVSGYRAGVDTSVPARSSKMVSFVVSKDEVQNIAAVWGDVQAKVVIE